MTTTRRGRGRRRGLLRRLGRGARGGLAGLCVSTVCVVAAGVWISTALVDAAVAQSADAPRADADVTLSDYEALLQATEEEIPVTPPGAAPTAPPGAAPKPEPASIPPSADGFAPDQALFLCPGLRVSNAPTHVKRKITPYRPFVTVFGVRIAAAPLNNACLSSGFGPRRGRLHKGVDYAARPGVMVYAAADGVVREAVWRDDYGYMLLIEHGSGVFTRYAHLRRFEKGLVEGERVAFGTPLGFMGNTSKYRLPVHLHYEILSGDYETPKKSFGLVSQSPFKSMQR